MVLGEEFGAVARDYPIAFVQVGPKQTFPVALLGLRAGENLFVNERRWERGRYVPAFVRRYPFVLTDRGDVCFDEGAANLSLLEGERLFDPEGAATPALAATMAFLSAFQKGVAATQAFTDRLRKLDLLAPWPVRVASPQGDWLELAALEVVDAGRLAHLNERALLGLFESGELAWIQAHRRSLAALDGLTARLPASATLSDLAA